MKLSTNVMIQIIAIVVQVLNFALPQIPERYKPLVLTIVGAGQGITAVIAHHSNTDGTPQSVAFKGDKV